MNRYLYAHLYNKMTTHKIINDPVYGFITINHPLIFDIVAHPFYQRLRRIHQMALAYLVYPGAVHTRLHHSLGAYHLMGNAINELKIKGVEITPDEEVAVKAAILLHDVGHGPYSHALENVLLPGVHHETISLRIMESMNVEMGGRLQLAIDIFTNKYPKKFLHQLISGQLDVDRMDYLTRDSFFTGVSEGVIGYDRIIKMLVVNNGELMVEEKGVYSIEKFLVARRQMYWQVYLHKTVLVAEQMLKKIVERVKFLMAEGENDLFLSSTLSFFLKDFNGELNEEALNNFLHLDDVDMEYSIKCWASHSDKVLSLLCNKVLNRQLLKIHMQTTPFREDELGLKTEEACKLLSISPEEAKYFVFKGETENTLYKMGDERINIQYKDGTIKDISDIADPLIHKTVAVPVKKIYICSIT